MKTSRSLHPATAIAIMLALLFGVGCGDSDGTGGPAFNSGISGTTSPAGGVEFTVQVGDPNPGLAETDRDVYFAAEIAVASLLNSGSDPLFLPGCAPFTIEQSLDGVWTFVGPPFLCVWEGIAVVLETNRIDSIEFVVPSESGLYRLRYEYSTGCEVGVPLSQANCNFDYATHTNLFEVERELCDPSHPDCRFVPGAPTVVCRDGENYSGPSEECTRDPETWACGFEFLSCP